MLKSYTGFKKKMKLDHHQGVSQRHFFTATLRSMKDCWYIIRRTPPTSSPHPIKKARTCMKYLVLIAPNLTLVRLDALLAPASSSVTMVTWTKLQYLFVDEQRKLAITEHVALTNHII